MTTRDVAGEHYFCVAVLAALPATGRGVGVLLTGGFIVWLAMLSGYRQYSLNNWKRIMSHVELNRVLTFSKQVKKSWRLNVNAGGA